MFLILVVGKIVLGSRQLGYWEGGKISSVGGILGHLPPGGSYPGGDILFHRYIEHLILTGVDRKTEPVFYWKQVVCILVIRRTA